MFIESSEKALSEKLYSLYEQKMDGNNTFIIRQLVNSKYTKNALVARHMNNVQDIIDQLTTMKIVIADERHVLLSLSYLSKS